LSEYGNTPGNGPLRPGGVSVSQLPTKADRPSTKSKAVEAMEGLLVKVRDLWNGDEAIKAKTTTYLPRAAGESPANYADRLIRSVCTNLFKQTVEALTGMICRRDPVLGDDVPPAIVDLWENIDNAGTHGDVFTRELITEVLVAGHAALLVDFPNTGGVQSAADEMKGAATRPVRGYVVLIKKDDIVSWRSDTENGALVLRQFVIRETSMVPDGEYGEKEQVQYRVLYDRAGVIGFELKQENDKGESIIVDEGTYPTLNRIPIVEVVGPDRKAMFVSAPPLGDLAALNIQLYQIQSDFVNASHRANSPIWVEIGAPPEPDGQPATRVIGPTAGIRLPIGGDAKWVAHDGAAMDSTQQLINSIKGDIATLGISMLSPEKRAAETATAKRIDKSSSDSKLSTVARAVQDAWEAVFLLLASYLRLPEGGSVTINRDFEDLRLSAQEMDSYVNAYAQGAISYETFLRSLQEGNLIPPDVDAAEEQGRIQVDAEIKQAMMPEAEPTQPKRAA
jgi:hypothetical protein